MKITGDGTTDLTAYIQSALDAGGFVELEGTCLVSATLIIIRKPVTLCGGTLKATSGAFPLIEIYGTEIVTIRDVRFEGKAALEDHQYGIYTREMGQSRDVSITGCRFVGLSNGIKLDTGSHRWQITGNRFSYLIGCEAGHGYGVLAASDRNIISGNVFTGGPASGRHAVYLSSGASYNIVSGNVTDGFQESAYCAYSMAGQQPCKHNLIQGNIARGCGRGTGDSAGIELDGLCERNKVSGNIITGFQGDGIIVSDAGCGQGVNLDNELSDNTVDLAGRHGVSLKNVSLATLRNNTVRDSSQMELQKWRGIVLQSTVDVSLMGNVSTGDSQREPFQLNQTVPLPAGTRQIVNSWQTW